MLRFIILLLSLLLVVQPAQAQLALSPTSFSQGQIISSATFTQLFTSVSNKALNRTGGTMTGALLFSPDNGFDIGQSNANRPRDLYLARNLTVGGSAVFSTVSVTSALTVAGTLSVTGSLAVSGTFTGTGVIGTSALASGAVTEAKIANAAVTSSKIAAGAINNGHVTGVTVFPRIASSETIAGFWDFTGLITRTGNFPEIRYQEADAPVNEKYWRWRANGSTFALQALDDPGTFTGTTALSFARTGIVINSAEFNVSVTFNAGMSGSGAGLTSLNASQLTSGSIPSARVSGSYTGITGAGALNAGSITSGFGTINIGGDALTAGAASFTTVAASSTVATGGVFRSTSPFAVVGGTTLVATANGEGGEDIGKASSSARYKQDINAPSLAPNALNQLVPKLFRYKANPSREYLGFIAEEVAAVLPEAVHYDAEGRPESLDHAALIAYLVATVQDLNARLEALEP